MQALEKTLSVRLPESTHAKLTQLTKVTGRTKRFLAITALEAYLDQQAWQIAEMAGLAEADLSEFATDAEMQPRVGTLCPPAASFDRMVGRGCPPYTNMRPISC